MVFSASAESIDEIAVTPERSYIICCNPRTGSWLLAETIEKTGIAGRPREYFMPEHEQIVSAQHNLRSFAAYLAWLRQAGSTPNGTLGIKAHWYQFADFVQRLTGVPPNASTDAQLREVFPDLRYVWLTRADRILQAISHYRAVRTQKWWRIDGPIDLSACIPPVALNESGDTNFNFEVIHRLLQQNILNDHHWQTYFASNGINPHKVLYEELDDQLTATVRRVLHSLSLDVPDFDTLVSAPRLRRQRDTKTREWARWYSAELLRKPTEKHPDADVAVTVAPLAEVTADPTGRARAEMWHTHSNRTEQPPLRRWLVTNMENLNMATTSARQCIDRLGGTHMGNVLSAPVRQALHAEARELEPQSIVTRHPNYSQTPGEWFSGPMSFASSPPGPWLSWLHSYQWLLSELRQLVGRDVQPTRQSYMYYESGSFVDLHTDVPGCDVTVLTTVAGRVAPLVLYPGLRNAPFERLRSAALHSAGRPPGGIEVPLSQGGLTILLGREVPHRRPEVRASMAALNVIATLCYSVS